MANLKKNPAAMPVELSRFEGVFRGILQEKGMSVSEAAEKLGYTKPQGLFAMITSGNPQLNSLLNMARILDINPAMFINRLYEGQSDKQYYPDQVVMLPYVDTAHYDTFIENLDDAARRTTTYYPVSTKAFDGAPARKPGKHLVVQVGDDSMSPDITRKSLVIAEEIQRSDYPYLTGGVYTVLVGSQFSLKRIHGNDMALTGQATLGSDNPLYGSLTVPAADIRFLGKVIGTLEKPVE